MKYLIGKVTKAVKTVISKPKVKGGNVARDSKVSSEKEINRRIDMAAEHTVKEYGEIIARLSKE